jgi:transposase InsO family protein
MSFGLCDAPGTFQGAMNSTLKPLLRKCVLVFFDDILIYSKSFAEHVEHLRVVLQLLVNDKWQVKLSKCSFAQRQISYLGHIVSSEGISTDNSKISTIIDRPAPSDAKEFRSFLGLVGYYRKFVKHFAIIACPLTALLKKHSLFVWTSDHQDAFEALKVALSSAPVMAAPDFSKQFCIKTDACAYGIGAVLVQDGHPLAFISKPLSPKHAGLSTYEKEYLAILLAVERWRSYLQHKEFLIFTDQRSLIHLSDQRLNTPWQQKVFTKLLGLQYKIVYKQGSSNKVADALSRRPHSSHQLSAVSTCEPSWSSAIIEGYSSDPFAQELVIKLAVSSTPVPHFCLQDGLIKFKQRIWVGANPQLQLQIMSALHDALFGGHSGFPVTYRHIKQLFAWKHMKTDIKTYVSQCQTCQQAKPDRTGYVGLLQPLPVPSSAWQSISMDFVEGLPRSHNKNCILVVVDRFTKYSHFIPLSHPFSAAVVVKAFFDTVYRLHGLPDSIISDRDKVFTSNFWKELFKPTKVTLSMSSSYHPQTDGQTERVNQCLETFLRCYVHACPSRWLDWLNHAEFWYNTAAHSAIGCSPFEALYSYTPRSLDIFPSTHCQSPYIASWVEDKKAMTDLLKQHLNCARQRMKFHADKHRQERTFEVGDSVFLKLQPYVQSSVALRANQKLSFKFFGPYKIVSKVGQVAYQLELPASASIHPVFHVSQLKKVVPASHQVSASLPDPEDVWHVPEKILAKRLVSKGSSSLQQVLIKWSGWSDALATWEDLEALRRQFPAAPAWGQAGSLQGGDVSTSASTDASTEAGPRRSTWPTFPNARLAGPEWN